MKITFKNMAPAVAILAGAFVLIFVLVLVLPARQKKLSQSASEKRIELIKKEIDSLELAKNRLIFTQFIEKRDSPNPISIFSLRELDFDPIFDTVPEIKALREDWLKKEDYVKELLNKDPEYRDMQKEADRAASQVEKKVIYDKMRTYSAAKVAKTPELEEAYMTRTAALSKQNAAIALFLLDYYQSKKQLMPTEGIIDYATIDKIISSNSELKKLSERIMILNNVLLYMQINDEMVKAEAE